jgi:flagellar basal body P-ring protein FlgI
LFLRRARAAAFPARAEQANGWTASRFARKANMSAIAHSSDVVRRFAPTAWLIGCGLLCGCTTPAVRSQSPEDLEAAAAASVRLIGDVAVPYGMYPIKVEAVGLVTGLGGTGSDPDPSPERAMLVHEMQLRGVKNPDKVLNSPFSSLVKVRGYLKPGIQKGDHFDLEVWIPSNSGTTSLRDGWLMQTRLKELAVLGNQVREGVLLALGEGAVMVDPSASEETDRVITGRGRILGGGVTLKTRPLGIVLRPDYQNVVYSAQVETAVNRRFHTIAKGIKEGVATAKTNEYIELSVHPRYKDNVPRYVQVVRSLALKETATKQHSRLSLLERQLMDPLVSSNAALRLEAMGREGIDVLKKGIRADDPEVRFYAAEALAYLDDSEAARPLAAAAREEPAFRVFAFTALSAMDDVAAYDELVALLHVPSAETRYGAFRALWAMNSHDALVQGESLGGQFSYHVVDSSGPPMIHVTRSYRPEVVLFGRSHPLVPPFAVEAGKQILVRSDAPGQVAVSKFAVNQPDQKRVVSLQADEVIRAIVELGGTYPDVVQALQQAKAKGALVSRFEVDALPRAGRRYYRDSDGEERNADPSATEESSGIVVSNPAPELFNERFGKEPEESRSKTADASTEEPEKRRPIRAFFDRMVGRGE